MKIDVQSPSKMLRDFDFSLVNVNLIFGFKFSNVAIFDTLLFIDI
jgi:hypothetical protein